MDYRTLSNFQLLTVSTTKASHCLPRDGSNGIMQHSWLSRGIIPLPLPGPLQPCAPPYKSYKSIRTYMATLRNANLLSKVSMGDLNKDIQSTSILDTRLFVISFSHFRGSQGQSSRCAVTVSCERSATHRLEQPL